MSVAIRAITRLQDADDAPSLGAGQNGYALTWNNATSAFVATALPAAGTTDHGALTGLTPDDDHTQYALLAGRAGGQTLYGGTAANEDITIHGTSSATRATSYVILQPTAGLVGIGTTTPTAPLHIYSSLTGASSTGIIFERGDSTAKAHLQVYYDNLMYVAQNIYRATDGYWYLDNAAQAGMYLGFFANQELITPQFAFNYAAAGAGARTIGNLMTILSTGNVGIGTQSPATLLHVISTTATTSALRNVLTLGVNVTGTDVGAAGLGGSILFQAESTTTVDTTQAAIEASWIVATHATRTSRLTLKAYDTAEREGIRIDASGTAALLGFYGHAAAAQPSAYTPSNVSADRAFDADTVAVAELADVVGTLIADLQSIGLLA